MPDPHLNALNDCVMAFDPDQDKFLFISPNINTMLGYAAADFHRNKNLLHDIIDPHYRSAVKDNVENLTEGGSVDLHYKVITANGVIKWVHDKRSLIVDEHAGNRVLLSIIRDHKPENAGQIEEIKLREQFLNSLIDSQTNFLVRFNTGGIFTFANKQFLKKLGYKKNEIIGKHFSKITVTDEIEMCRKAFLNCIKHPGRIVNHTHKKITKTGSILSTEWEFISVTNNEGVVTAIQGIGRDITQKLVVEKESKETAEKLEHFIESITDSFFILDKEWKIIKINSAFEKVASKSREELIGNNIWEIYPGILNTGFEEAYRMAAAENIKTLFSGYFEPLNMWFNITVYPSPEGLTVFVKNITGEKHAREELIWTKNSLESLINNTEDQIWSVDKDTRYVYMNKPYREKITELTGVEPKEGGYSYLHMEYGPDVIARWKEYYARALNGEIYSIINESVNPHTQELQCFEISFNPIYNSINEITGAGCFARNITERLKTEKAIIDQNERLRQIASLTSHELRRPVASMLGLINIMDRNNFYNPDNKEIIEHLLTVGVEIDQVIRLIVDKAFTGDLLKNSYQRADAVTENS